MNDKNNNGAAGLRGVRRVAAATVAVLAIASTALAQSPNPQDHKAHNHPASAPSAKSVADEIQELRGKVARLEAALQTGHQPGTPAMGTGAGMTSGMSGMSGGMKLMDDMPMSGGGMKMMDDNMPMGGGMSMGGGGMPMGGMGMSGMPMGGMAGGGMDQGMMQMKGMMGMAPGAGMAMPSALPGFPGASHLYHVGSTGFFLDHAEHVTLTTQQQMALNAAKEKALLDKASAQRGIDGAEQELWTLTASDQPDAEKIEPKVREIEKLRGDQRLGFIRAVGEAAKVLTEEQRKSLLGQLPPQNPGTQRAPGGSTSGAGGMKDM